MGDGAAPAATASGDRNEDLLAVGERRGEVDERDVGARRRSACRRDRVGDPRAGRQVVEARPADGPCDVDDELRGG